MTDAPAQTADAAERAPSEPVTPIQTPAQDRVLGTRRRSSTNETNTAIPFASASEASRIRNAITNNFNMMSLAQMSSPHPMGMTHIPQTPTVVTPAQVTLPKNIAEGGNPFEENMYPFPTVEEGLESFARVEFADSVFQMTTYAVIIGRDQRAMDQAKRDERRAGEYRRIAEEHANMGLPPPSPEMHDRNRKFSKSYVSEEGGMLGPESDGESTTRPQKRRKQTRSGSPQDEVEQEDAPLIMDRQYVSHTPGAAAVDLKSLRPSPHHTPFIGIHSPGPDIASKTKAISREHLKIQFNPKKNVFEAIPLHKNGFFCDDVHYRQESVVLRSGSRLQIKDVDFTFIVNGVGRGRTGAEDLEDGPKLARRYAEGGKEMSVEFELGQNKGDMVSDSDELSDLEESPAELSEDAEGELKSESEAEDADGDAVMREQMPEQPAKRRGPGRPPKDGIMSKRERRELAKLEQELERQRQLETHVPAAEPVPYSSPTGELGDVPMKRKVGRPRKHPLPEGEDGKPEKRKYKPRKPKEEEGSEAERRRERKERRLARPKSPPLKLRREDFTEEQLSKPNKNYGILIDEVLREAGADGLILKQIYNRISAKYPFYHFCTETKGWESSVRHNLIGNSAFSKDPKSGAWTRVLGIELDAGKKRKGDAAAAERASAAASAAAAANGGQPYGVGAYGNATYPGYGAGGHKVPPGAVQGYSQPGGSIQGYQHGQQQGNAMGMGQTYPGQPGQAVHQLSQSPHLGTPPTGVTPRPAGVAPSAQQHTNGNAQAPTTGAAVNYPRHASGTPQLNGTTATPGANVHNPYYGTHSQTPNQAQPANGVAFPSRQTLAPRPAVLHPKLLAQLKKFVKGLHSHAGLDRRWVFSAFNRVLGLKTQANKPRPDTLLHTNKGSPLAEVMNKRLVSALEGIVSRYINEHVKAKAKEPASSSAIEGNEILHPDLVALFFELKETFQRGRTAAADGDNKEDKDKEREREKDKEMGEYMVLSCFDRVVGARDESIFEGLKEEGVMEEKEAARWVAAEAELVRVVKACVLKLGFTLSS
ncbi:uncharacterized protein DNG_02403 [Cephalotrichum gorgonifer]|uniref:Fork-head domain-containing protein n=1 Tax=Cephalotrichum gorgonifer TaxID=2041049 RepID=A0AAE8MTI1_9PEZI|nr:uncharacterized protein DNG_02403 [Cephalotrichum gorgonifer]